jgi:glycosyltransferase involved in cell wall biosynthesis
VKPLVSIITVSFNSAMTIEKTIESVKNQSYKNIEYIVIDGNSTDHTMNIIQKYAFISKIVSEKDKGIYDAMNKGLALANGDMIAFLNSDDHYLNEYVVQKVVDIFMVHQVDAVFGDVGYFSLTKHLKLSRRYSSRNFSSDKLKNGLMPAHPSLFMKKKIFNAYGIFDSNFKIAGDFELIARIFKSNAITYRYIPEILVMMQLGGVSTQGFRSTILLNKEIIMACKKNGIKTSWFNLLLRYPRKLIEFFYLKGIN